jgi:hypothetical protein
MPFIDAAGLAKNYRARPPLHFLVAGFFEMPTGEDDGDDSDGELTEADVRELRALGIG